MPNAVHTLFRLNQRTPAAASERIIGKGRSLYSQQLPADTPVALGTSGYASLAFDGNPLSVLDFRFDGDPAAWAIIANAQGMRKHRLPGLYQVLGLVAPDAAANATDNGGGNLNGGFSSSGVIARAATASPNGWVGTAHEGAYEKGVDQGYGWGTDAGGAQAYTDPQKAYDGDLTTFAWWAGQHTHQYAGCVWTFAYAGVTPVSSIYLNVLSEVPSSGTDGKIVTQRSAGIWYSLDAGTTWVQIYNSPSRPKQWDTIQLPAAQNINNVQVMAFADSHDDMYHKVYEIDIASSAASTPGYDWLYTWVNPTTKTESNPSPANYALITPSRPTAFVTPDPTLGGAACTNPASAYDGDPNTFASIGGGAHQSVIYSGWAAIGTIENLQLNIDLEVVGTATGDDTVQIDYSFDDGDTWTNALLAYNKRSRYTATVSPAIGVDISLLKVRANTLGTDLTLRIHDINVGSLVVTANDGSTTNLTVATLTLTNRQALVNVKAPTDPQQTVIRLYRRGGSLTDTYYRVGDYPISTLSQGTAPAGWLQIEDNAADEMLTDAVEFDNDMPVSSVTTTAQPLPFIWGPFNGRILGVGDPGRPDAIYFSKVGNADAWPPQNWVTAQSPGKPLLCGCMYNTRSFAFSTEGMEEQVEGISQATTMQSFKTPCTRGPFSPWALCVRDAVYFGSKDGVYRTTGGVEESIVEDTLKPLWPTKDEPLGRTCHGYEPIDLTHPELYRLTPHNDEIYLTYAGATTGAVQTLVYDTRKSRWRVADYAPEARCYYSEPGVQSLLVGCADGNVYQTGGTTDAGTAIPVAIRTGAHDLGFPLTHKEFGSVLIDLDPGGATLAQPVTITPYLNGEAITEASLTVTGTGRRQVALSLDDVMAYNLELGFEWTRTALIAPVLYQYELLWRLEPTAVTHWETREMTYGMPGWFHLRDGYLGIRSTGVVNIKVYCDGTLLTTLAIASTAGLRRKVYFSVPANKMKQLRLVADSADGSMFRIYHEDCEWRLKPWLTSLGYQNIRALGGETQLMNPAVASMYLSGAAGGGGQ